MKMSNKLWFLALLLILNSCKQQASVSQAQKESCREHESKNLIGEVDPIASPMAKVCGTLNLWGGDFPKSLNMWQNYSSFAAQIMGYMFEPLVGMHSVKNEPIGVLAERWEISEDQMTYTFHLRPQARWSDGRAITAQDIQFYYDVIMDPKNLTPIFKVGLKRFSRPEIIDSLTIRLTAKEPHWNNFWELAGLTAFPHHIWKDVDFNAQKFDFPVVSGPYQIKELKKDRYLLLEQRKDWWGRQLAWNQNKLNFEQLRFRFMSDRVKALEAFKRGDLDMYPIYTSSIWMMQTDFESVQKGWVNRQQIFNKEPIGFQGMAINLRQKKFQDPRVRKALALLLNRQQLNEKYMYNQYFLLNSYYPDLWDNNINPNFAVTPFDSDSARALLKEAGWKVNKKGQLEKNQSIFSIVFMTASPDKRHLSKYQEDLQAVGFDVKIEEVAASTLSKRLEKFDYDMYWMAWGAGRLRDPESAWHSTTANQEGSNNIPGVADAYIDSLIMAQKTEPSLDKRNEILKLIDRRLNEIIPYVLLWQSDHHRVLYWNRYGTPGWVYDKFNREESAVYYWWFNNTMNDSLEKAMQAKQSIPSASGDIRYQGP
jgi:microcin C transport system substrate-binding protein